LGSLNVTKGFSCTVPLPDPLYPRRYCERPIALGGTKVYDLRRVQINSSQEERQFLAVVNREDWMLDAVTSHWGARGVRLETLTREHKEVLNDLIERDLLEIGETPAADLEAPAVNVDSSAPADDDAVASGADPNAAPE
jgi:hypothetical protein